MELIRNLGTRTDKTGAMQSWAEFYCEECKNYVERRLGNGLVAKSCGCVRYKLSAESNKGKKRTIEQRQKISKTRIEKGVAKGENNPFYGKKHTEESRQKIKDNHVDFTGENSPLYGKHPSEKTRWKMRESHKGITTEKHGEECKCYGCKSKRGGSRGENNPMYGKSGELSPNWQGGKSFEEYTQEFNKELKQFILERDNYKCQDPTCDGNHTKLHIHHIDYVKKNNNSENLITLCSSCHSKTNGKNNRNYFMEFYQTIMINKLMECLL